MKEQGNKTKRYKPNPEERIAPTFVIPDLDSLPPSEEEKKNSERVRGVLLTLLDKAK